jgi:hypothetical protein
MHRTTPEGSISIRSRHGRYWVTSPWGKIDHADLGWALYYYLCCMPVSTTPTILNAVTIHQTKG